MDFTFQQLVDFHRTQQIVSQLTGLTADPDYRCPSVTFRLHRDFYSCAHCGTEITDQEVEHWLATAPFAAAQPPAEPPQG